MTRPVHGGVESYHGLLPALDRNFVEYGGSTRQLLLACGESVRCKNVRDDVGVTLRAKTARAAHRHLTFGESKKRSDRDVTPLLEEAGAGKLRTVIIALQLSAMA